MPWIKFISDYHWWLPMTTKPFKAGTVVFATRALAQAAIADGVAETTVRPSDATDEEADG